MLLPEFKSLKELEKVFKTEQDCIDYFEGYRGKGKPVSPHDPTSKVYKCANNRYKCKNTGKYFNVRTGTIFENSKISLKDWFGVGCIFFSHKKGVSSCQLAKDLGVTQKTAGFVLERLRRASRIAEFKTMLKGFVQIDETFVGGKNKNRHGDKKAPKCQGRNGKDKTPSLGMLQEDGNLIVRVVPNTKMKTLLPIIRNNVKEGSTLYSDDGYRHSDLSQDFNHQWVNHSAKQYVNGKATTNSIEGFWSHLKRGINGTYHGISKKHLQDYVNEFAFRYNTRKYSEQERFNAILLSSIGKRLTYQQLIS